MKSGVLRTAAVGLIVAGLTACAARPEPEPPGSQAAKATSDFGGAKAGIAVFDPATVIQDDWMHLALNGKTDYRMVYLDGRLAIRAEPRDGASGLIRRVSIDSTRCPTLEWSWRVEQLQESADLRIKEADDVAASIFLLFGDPGFLFDPSPVPTLRYVWTNERVSVESVIDSPYMPGTVRSLVVRSGIHGSGQWTTQKRDVGRDFRTAFGYAPPGPVRAVAIFTDNDQTGGDKIFMPHFGAHFGWGHPWSYHWSGVNHPPNTSI